MCRWEKVDNGSEEHEVIKYNIHEKMKNQNNGNNNNHNSNEDYGNKNLIGNLDKNPTSNHNTNDNTKYTNNDDDTSISNVKGSHVNRISTDK